MVVRRLRTVQGKSESRAGGQGGGRAPCIAARRTFALAYSGRNDFDFGAANAEVPERATTVVVTANEAGAYESTRLLAQLLQMTLGALLEL